MCSDPAGPANICLLLPGRPSRLSLGKIIRFTATQLRCVSSIQRIWLWQLTQQEPYLAPLATWGICHSAGSRILHSRAPLPALAVLHTRPRSATQYRCPGQPEDYSQYLPLHEGTLQSERSHPSSCRCPVPVGAASSSQLAITAEA